MGSHKLLRQLALTIPTLRRVYADFLTVRGERDDARSQLDAMRLEVAGLRNDLEAERSARKSTEYEASAASQIISDLREELEERRLAMTTMESEHRASETALKVECQILEAEVARSKHDLLKELRQLVREELKQGVPPLFDPQQMFEDVRQRLVNIEYKTNRIQKQIAPIIGMHFDLVASKLGHQQRPPYGFAEDQRFGSVSFAQHGEDFIFSAIFDKLGIEEGTYLDIGAHHPFKLSNTALLNQNGWSGINVDANPDLIEQFVVWRPSDLNLNVGVSDKAGSLPFYRFDATSGLNTFDRSRVTELESKGIKLQDVIEVPVITITEVLARHEGPMPHLLSLDVEGFDLRILQSIDYTKFKPMLVCVEANSPSDEHDLTAFLSAQDYELVFKSASNLFFLDSFLRAKLLNAAPISAPDSGLRGPEGE